MRIIPAIDLINGACVRLEKGDFKRKIIYDDNPLVRAKKFEDAGLKNLHLVDLDGSKQKQVVNWDVIRDICCETNLFVDFGGGVRQRDDLARLFDLGVEQVNVGSAAILAPDRFALWVEEFGAERIILSADVRDRIIAINAWQEDSQLNIFDFIQYQIMRNGLLYFCVTDIAQDGMLTGPSFALYDDLQNQFPGIRIIASGGVSNIEDVRKLKQGQLDGVIIGKAIYEERIALKELVSYVD